MPNGQHCCIARTCNAAQQPRTGMRSARDAAAVAGTAAAAAAARSTDSASDDDSVVRGEDEEDCDTGAGAWRAVNIWLLVVLITPPLHRRHHS